LKKVNNSNSQISQDSGGRLTFKETLDQNDTDNWKGDEWWNSTLKENQTWNLMDSPIEAKELSITGRSWLFRNFQPNKSIIRVVLAMAAAKKIGNKSIQHKNHTISLWWLGTRDIYIQQSIGFEDGTNRICKLQKGIYGLWQANVDIKFINCLTKLDIKFSKNDRCLFICNDEKDKMYIYWYTWMTD